MRALFIPLKSEWFRAFERGDKTTEFRLYDPRWNETTVIPGRPVTLSHGYSGARITATVKRMRLVKNTITDLYPADALLCAIDLSGL